MLKQANKRDAVRAKFIAADTVIQNAINRLGLALQVHISAEMSDVAIAARNVCTGSALDRSDLLAFYDRYREEIAAERECWTEEQRNRIDTITSNVVNRLDENAQQQAVRLAQLFSAHTAKATSSSEMNTQRIIDALARLQLETPRPSAASPSNSAERFLKDRFTELRFSDLHIDVDDDSTCLGEGTAGEVFRGHWTPPNALATTGRGVKALPIAFKKLKLPRSISAEERAALERAFQREALLMWMLNGHANTVQMLGVVREKKHVGFVFELCNAGTLKSHLYIWDRENDTWKSLLPPSAGALTLTDQLSCAMQLINAVSFAHGKAVVHRDLKSINVLCCATSTENGDSASSASAAAAAKSGGHNSAGFSCYNFKVSDFGSARALEHIVGMTALESSSGGSRSMASGATLRWCAPELQDARFTTLTRAQQKKLQHAFAVDIYSLGLVLGEVFLRQPPFPSLEATANAGQLQQAICGTHTHPHDPAALRHLSPRLAELIAKCCAKDPQQRPTIAQLQYQLWPPCLQELAMPPGTALALRNQQTAAAAAAAAAAKPATAAAKPTTAAATAVSPSAATTVIRSRPPAQPARVVAPAVAKPVGITCAHKWAVSTPCFCYLRENGQSRQITFQTCSKCGAKSYEGRLLRFEGNDGFFADVAPKAGPAVERTVKELMTTKAGLTALAGDGGHKWKANKVNIQYFIHANDYICR